MSSDRPYDLLLLGASVAGIELVYQLRKKGMWRREPGFSMAVVDQRDRHAYIPLIHEKLVGREDFGVDTRKSVQRGAQVEFIKAEVLRVDLRAGRLSLEDGRELWARALVIALGSVVAAPESIDPEGRSYALKFAEQCESLRAAIEYKSAALAEGQKLELAVIGGGISGVEIAGELLRWSKQKARMRVSLLYRGAQLLPGLTRRAGDLAQQALRAQGARLCPQHELRALVADADQGDRLQFESKVEGERAGEGRFDLVIWAGGIGPAPLLAQLGVQRDERGWLRVDPWFRLHEIGSKPGPASVLAGRFAIGDAVRVYGPGENRAWPTMARAIECLWQAQCLASSLIAARSQGAWDWEERGLKRHRLRSDFPHGISAGKASIIAWGPLAFDFGALGRVFRRFLGRMYRLRYRA